MPSNDELRDLLMLNGMLNADAKDVNSKLTNESAGKMGVRGMNPKEMLTKVAGPQNMEQVIPPPLPTIKVNGIDGQFEVSAPMGLIPMNDISPDIISRIIPNNGQPQPQVTMQNPNALPPQPTVPKNQQEFTFVGNLSKQPTMQEQMWESIKNIELQLTSIAVRIKRIEDYLVNRKRKIT
jgi:hypothetical protein